MCIKKILMENMWAKKGVLLIVYEFILKYVKKRGQGKCQVASCVYFAIERLGKWR